MKFLRGLGILLLYLNSSECTKTIRKAAWKQDFEPADVSMVDRRTVGDKKGLLSVL